MIKIWKWPDMNFELILSLIINSSSLKIKIVRKNIFYEISHYFLKEIHLNTLINLICDYVISKYLILQIEKNVKKFIKKEKFLKKIFV
jgi:hypothetical protein